MKFIITSGHGYLKVTLNQLKKALVLGAKFSTYSYINKHGALLEEDNDAIVFLKTMGLWETRDSIKNLYQNDINRFLYDSFNSVDYHIVGYTRKGKYQ